MTFLQDPDFLFKIVIVGNSAVGKSTILKTATEQVYEPSFLPTIGVDFKIHTYQIDGKIVKLHLWDTAGQERFQSICRSYYKGAHGVIFVYDVTDKASFMEMEKWVEDVERIAGPEVDKILLGNKCDLEDQRKVGYEEGGRFAEEHGIKFMETSAKTSFGVGEAFLSMASGMKSKFEKEKLGGKSRNGKEILIKKEENKRDYTCCPIF